MRNRRMWPSLIVLLSLPFSACSSDSDAGNDAGKKDGPADVRRSDGPRNATPDTRLAGPCVVAGTTYQPGQSFTNNCITYTCVGGTELTRRGAPCADAAGAADSQSRSDGRNTDQMVARDSSAGPESGRDVAAEGGALDRPSDARRSDVAGGDTGSDGTRDVAGTDDLASEDTSPDERGDLPALQDAPVTCRHADVVYSPGDEFPCDCNTCICSAAGQIRQLTSNVCAADGGVD